LDLGLLFRGDERKDFVGMIEFTRLAGSHQPDQSSEHLSRGFNPRRHQSLSTQHCFERTRFVKTRAGIEV